MTATRRASAYALATILVALSFPPLGQAASGGASLDSASGQLSGDKLAATGNTTVSASGGGIRLATRASTFLRGELRFSGSVPAADAGDVIEVQRLGHQTGWAWAATADARVNRDGRFSAVWLATHIGRFEVRVVIEGSTAPRAAAASPMLTVTVYRASIATQYGPGFYGRRTACGEVLRPNTVGVANRTLECGSLVALYYQGRTLVVPVIDRGPYANGADWDLTEATGHALALPGTATVGAVSLPQ